MCQGNWTIFLEPIGSRIQLMNRQWHWQEINKMRFSKQILVGCCRRRKTWCIPIGIEDYLLESDHMHIFTSTLQKNDSYSILSSNALYNLIKGSNHWLTIVNEVCVMFLFGKLLRKNIAHFLFFFTLLEYSDNVMAANDFQIFVSTRGF